MRWPWRKSRRLEVERLARDYAEGRRLMRHGDGADEWAGMAIARRALLGLVERGCDEYGEPSSLEARVRLLRLHGLRNEAAELEAGRRG